jgi:hypothetical protein
MDGTCQARDFMGGICIPLVLQKSKSKLSTSIRLRIAMLNKVLDFNTYCFCSSRQSEVRLQKWAHGVRPPLRLGGSDPAPSLPRCVARFSARLLQLFLSNRCGRCKKIGRAG